MDFTSREKLILATYYAAWTNPTEINHKGRKIKIIKKEISEMLDMILGQNMRKVFKNLDEAAHLLEEIRKTNVKISELTLDTVIGLQMDQIIKNNASQ